MDLRQKTIEVCEKYGTKKKFLAEKLGVSIYTISRYLHNKTNLPPEKEQKLAQILIKIEESAKNWVE
ncbi:helix-turn-helix domain-containing protein [Caldicoprobacter faecalis]|uniref:Helix-turn-helix n=1 Tax=Caldicoprobacter faecalis TaxID=937334 RepID=A0A1I5WUY3_9FIRM|nr:helix-turn-helix transcriptional regulator [Caldicoprobacter faecalis]SFQ23428.1 Helix-turn-helix [Caldicoprobacter faecalis]